MKKVSILIIVLVAVIALFQVMACKKHNAVSYYFKFQKGDSTYSLDSIFAIIDTTAGVYTTTVYSLPPYSQSNVWIQLVSVNGSVTGNYSSGYSTANPAPNELFRIVPGSSIYIPYPRLMSYTIAPSYPFTLTISTASKTAIGGYFSGSDSTAITGTFLIPVDSL